MNTVLTEPGHTVYTILLAFTICTCKTRNFESMSLTSLRDERSWKLSQPKQPINVMAPVTQLVPGHDATQG
jgi:hypothetical protein